MGLCHGPPSLPKLGNFQMKKGYDPDFSLKNRAIGGF
jgi:hypothetical protein